jgi:hypothetical protein
VIKRLTEPMPGADGSWDWRTDVKTLHSHTSITITQWKRGFREDLLDEATTIILPTLTPREILPEKAREANPLVVSRSYLKLMEIFL